MRRIGWGLTAAAIAAGVPAAIALADRDEGAREVIEAHVRCAPGSGPPFGSLHLSRARAIRAARRIVIRDTRSRRTLLGRFVAGRRFSLHDPGTLEQEPRILVGATFDLRFERPTRVKGMIPAYGFVPKAARRRYERRWGYMLYYRRGAGTVRALEVDVDVRRGRVAEVYSSFDDGDLERYDPVPGPCPLLKPPPSHD